MKERAQVMHQSRILAAKRNSVAMRFFLNAAALIMLTVCSHAYGQSVDPLVDQGVKLRIEQQELTYLRRTRQIDEQEYQRREQARYQRGRDFQQRMSRLPTDQQISLQQQITNRFAIVFPPLQQQWNAKERAIQEQDRALAESRAKELAVDAARAAELQAMRTSLQRQLQQGAITSEAARAKDAASIAEITGLQNKYVAYGGQWAAQFNGRMEQLAAQLVRTQDAKERVADTTSEVGRDAHRAGEIYLAIKRNEMRRARSAITAADMASENTALQKELDKIKAKYAAGGALGASRADFEDRYTQLGERAAGKYYQQWSK